MYIIYVCVSVYLYICLRDHNNDLFYSEFYPFINSSTLHLGGKRIICDRSSCIKGKHPVPVWETEYPKYIYIYTNMYQLCFLYFFETLHDTCRYVYIIICWSRDTNKTIFRGVNLVWNIFGELERLGMYSSLPQAIPTCSFSEALVFVVSRCGASCSRRC